MTSKQLISNAIETYECNNCGKPITKKQAEAFFMCLLFNVENALVRKGEEVRLLDTGKFKVKNLKPKIGRNPKTGEKVEIPARKKIVFVPSALLNNALNEGGF